MNRRELLKLIAATTGTALIGGHSLTAFASGLVDGGLNASEVRLLDEVAETLLPRTDTPGAKDARVGEFMQVFVRDCYADEEQQLFQDGLAQIEARSHKVYGNGFLALDTSQRGELITELDREARVQVDAGNGPHYFTLIKQLTLFGFFTSEVGATEVLRYVAVPGHYDGELTYEPGQPAWATT